MEMSICGLRLVDKKIEKDAMLLLDFFMFFCLFDFEQTIITWPKIIVFLGMDMY